jgi:1-deoxy-D-xylulose-5-phosphate synthase
VEEALENLKKTLRMTISPSRLFESLNILYFGPVDGHDIGSLIKLFEAVSDLDQPAILHVYTKKGKGFTPAGDDPCKFHSTGPFEMNGKITTFPKAGRTFTEAFADTLVELAQNDDRIVAITAAMPDGTGLVKFREKFGERYYDVGIAESAAVDVAAGLAKQGQRPVVCIYSTFLQRSYDQIFQEVALQNLPVVFCIDRSGVVGNDGPTHHGLTDIGFLRMLPNMVLTTPASETEMKAALNFAFGIDRPVAIRYPRDVILDGVLELPGCQSPFELGKSVTVRQAGSDVVVVALGSILAEAVKAADVLAGEGIDVGVINARFAKPIDEKIISLLYDKKNIITVEEHGLACGFGSAVLELAAKKSFEDKTRFSPHNMGKIITLGGPDEFIKVGSRSTQLDEIGVSAALIVEAVKTIVGE